jgi:hypothetical protein
MLQRSSLMHLCARRGDRGEYREVPSRGERHRVTKDWATDREQRARIIGEWLQIEARYLA